MMNGQELRGVPDHVCDVFDLDVAGGVTEDITDLGDLLSTSINVAINMDGSVSITEF